MWNTLLMLAGVFAYLSIGYYIAERENKKNDFVRIRLLRAIYTVLGPPIVVAYTLFRVLRFGFRRLVSVPGVLRYNKALKEARLLAEARVRELEMESNDPVAREKGQKEREQMVKEARLKGCPDAKVLQFPRKL